MTRNQVGLLLLACTGIACTGGNRNEGDGGEAGGGSASDPSEGSGEVTGATSSDPTSASEASSVDDSTGDPTDGTDTDDGPPPLGECDGEAIAAVECAGGCASWCDAASWGGAVPDAQTDVVIAAGMGVRLDCDAVARTVTIEPGGSLVAARDASSTLTLGGNLVVRGRLDLGTATDRIPDGITTEIVFTGMDDDAVVGTPTVAGFRGPTEVVDGDIGLWVVGDGIVTGGGSLKRAWSRLRESTAPGDAGFVVDDATGWQPGDRVALTPTVTTAEEAAFLGFDERTIAEVDGAAITLDAAPDYTHDGCSDCMRRGEAINLTRNVVIRSADDTNHAHILVGDRGVLQLDSVELRWLGPHHLCGSEGIDNHRRSALWFYQQGADADPSFVCHSAIWGGDRHFLVQEQSDGISIVDVAGYDTEDDGFVMYVEDSFCVAEDCDAIAPRGTVLTDVIAAHVGSFEREQDCLRINHALSAFSIGGDEGTGCVRCVAAGIGTNGSGADISGFRWPESGSARPLDYRFEDNVVHNVAGHGMYMWQNNCDSQELHENVELWSLARYGMMWGAYGCAYSFAGLVIEDTVEPSIGVKAISIDNRPRLEGAEIDDMEVLAYVLPQDLDAHEFVGVHFTGVRPVAVRQNHDPCVNGDEHDPSDSECQVAHLRFTDPSFGEGVTNPFEFGWTENFHTSWEVSGFSHPAFPNVPSEFVLYRPDNEVEGGCHHPVFDAWLVPGNGGASCE